MWDSASGKIIIVIILAIAALVILRVLSKQSFKLVKPTWSKTQTDLTQNVQPVQNQIDPNSISFRQGII